MTDKFPAPTADTAQCQCRACVRLRPVDEDGFPHELGRMILCQKCGNKRCPHANDHQNACTNSNEPGQPGSAYP